MTPISITTQGLELSLEQFSGPMDVLLHLIRENQINILDIPICEITEAYLAFVQKAQRISFDVAGEYLVMASWLLYLKSKTLLPPSASDSDTETQELDPQKILAEKLWIYSAFQKTAHILQQGTLLERDTFVRQDAEIELIELGISAKTVELAPSNTLELAKTYLTLMTAYEKRLLEIEVETLSFDQLCSEMAQDLSQNTKVHYDFSLPYWTPVRVVFTVMVLLELTKQGMLALTQERHFFPILASVLKQSEITQAFSQSMEAT